MVATCSNVFLCVCCAVYREAVGRFGAEAIVSGTGPMMVSMPLAGLLGIPLFHGNYLPLAFSYQDWPMPCGSSGHAILAGRLALGSALFFSGLGLVGAVLGLLVAPRLVRALAFFAYRELGSRLLYGGYNSVREQYGLKHETRRVMWHQYQHVVPRIGSYCGAFFRGAKNISEAVGYFYGPAWYSDVEASAEESASRERVKAFAAQARARGRAVVSIGWGSMMLLSSSQLSALALAAAAMADVSVVLLGGWSGISVEALISGLQLDGEGKGEQIDSSSCSLVREMVAAGEDALAARGVRGGLLHWAADHALSVAHASHSHVYPQMDAVVHHGGSGTTHAAARAGTPAIVTPVLGDQGGWAERVETAGAGLRGPALCHARPGQLGGLIRRVVEEDGFRQAAARLREHAVREGGADEAVRRIEKRVGRYSGKPLNELVVGGGRRAPSGVV